MARPGSAESTSLAAPSRVLVAVDDDGAAELLIRILERAGFLVARAATYDEALSAVTARKPEAAILGLRFGGLSHNLRLVESMRSHVDRTIADTRVVLLLDTDADASFLWDAGVDALFSRPVAEADLVRELRAALARSTADRAEHRQRSKFSQ